jgi:hypothetical protein
MIKACFNTILANATRDASVRGYVIESIAPVTTQSMGEGFVALCAAQTSDSTRGYPLHARFLFGADGAFHSCNYFRTFEGAYDAFWDMAAAR